LHAACVSSRADEQMHPTSKPCKLTQHVFWLKAGYTSCSGGQTEKAP